MDKMNEENKNNMCLTEEDMKEGKEIAEMFYSLNDTGRLLVNTFIAGLKGKAVIEDKKQEEQKQN